MILYSLCLTLNNKTIKNAKINILMFMFAPYIPYSQYTTRILILEIGVDALF